MTVFLAGCGSKVETSRPFIDSSHNADVLVEQRALSNPRSIDQNRLLRGWRFVRHEDRPRLIPNAPESVVEIVHLVRRPRQLIIEVIEYRTGDAVRVRVGRQSLGSFPISERVEIDLPADLPLGRVVVTLGFSNHETTVLAGLSISPNVAKGAAAIEPGVIEQSGWSAVEVVHRVDAEARFNVDFHPPATVEPGRRFVVAVQREHAPAVEVFSWDSGSTPPETGLLKVDVPLGETAGLARIRLLAVGAGAIARWVDPRIVEIRTPPGTGPPISPGEPPRLVVLYVMDALRSDHVGRLAPYGKLTPVLDGMATEGVSFANHFAVAPNTPPSTRSLFTGLVMLDDRRLPHPGPPRLAEVFRESGYRTVSITGNPHLSPELDLGTGFDSVELLRVREDHNPERPPTVNTSAEILHEAATRWIVDLGRGERGFLYLHTMNPHNPYTPPPELEDRIAPSGSSDIDGRTRTLVAIRDLQREVNPADVDRLRGLYAASVAYNDQGLTEFIDTINRKFDPEEVLLIITSDHGEELFEHSGVLHGYTLYDEMLRIPLIIRWPARITPKKIADLTNTLDLHATLIELAAASPGRSTGTPLWPRILGRDAPAPVHQVTFAAAPGLAGGLMARSRRWKLISAPRDGIRRGQGKGRGRSWDLEFVFDLESDPSELHNLAGASDLEVAWLRTRLMAWVKVQQALQPSPGDQVMDDETKDQLEALGYVVDP